MITEIVHQVIILLGSILVLTLVYLAGSVIALLACRIRIDEVNVFYGPAIISIKTPLGPVAVGCLPCGGSVSYDVQEFDRRPLLVRYMVILSGVFAQLLVAGVCLGIGVAVSQFGSGFIQIAWGAVAPFAHGTPLVRAFFERANESLFLGCGLCAAKLAAFNMLPIPPMSGGRLLTEIPRNRQQSVLWRWVNVIGALLIYAMVLTWLLALVNSWRHM